MRSAREVTLAGALMYGGAVNSSISNTVVVVAFPVFAEVFHQTPGVVAWIAICFTLTSASLLTACGRLSDMHGRRGLYALGLSIFVVGTVLCSLSANIGMLLGFRIMQGMGAALVNANSLAYLVEIYPANRRGSIVGLWEACIAAGIAVGPIIGGLLQAAFGWRSLFYVSIPLSLVVLALVPRFMFEPERPIRRQRFDVPGALLFASGVASLLYAFTDGYDRGFTSPLILACLGYFLAATLAFLWVERTVSQPMIDLGMFSNWKFSAGSAAKVFAYAPYAAHSFLLPFYLEQAAQLPSAQVGLALLPLAVGHMTASLLSGQLSDRFGARFMAPLGLAIEGAGALLFTQVRPENGLGLLLVAMFLGGAGLGTFIAPNDSSILSVTQPDKLGVANGIMGISRQFGIVLGYSAAAGLLGARTAINGGMFVAAFHDVYLVIAVVAFAGIWLAALRGKRPPSTRLAVTV
ncbi:MAG: MFS transporter [Chloroflexi bacterium]|nr:MFS transporter [Chloroflexota bacterium]